MTTDHRPQVETWLEHVRVLAERIGPRPSTRDEERQGAEHCRATLDRLGLDPSVETFSSAREAFQPHLVTGLALLGAFALYPWGGRATAVAAAVLSAVVLGSELAELSFRGNLLRHLVAKGPSQNVVATVPPAGEHRRDVVLIGHLDTQRTPVFFRSFALLVAYVVFTFVAALSFGSQVVLFALGAVFEWGWVWPAAVPAAVSAVLLVALCLEALRSPFTPGANDNATAVGLVLTIGQHLRSEPLAHTRVWLLCSGCEEVAHYGAIDFFRRHRSELVEPSAIALEMLGCAGPRWLVSEGIVVPFRSDRRLRALAEQIAAERPELRARPGRAPGGNTEMADALRAGVPAIALVGLDERGLAPHWHTMDDTFDKIDPEVLGRSYELTWDLLRRIDAGSLDRSRT
ncbi:MAG: M28 family peptidase [Acidimicrobiia bacterium]|nr:M28 family peptidase [Acidimicrobiia bacterium]